MFCTSPILERPTVANSLPGAKINSEDCPVAVGMSPISSTALLGVYVVFVFGVLPNGLRKDLIPGILLPRAVAPITVAPSAANPPTAEGSLSSFTITVLSCFGIGELPCFI